MIPVGFLRLCPTLCPLLKEQSISSEEMKLEEMEEADQEEKASSGLSSLRQLDRLHPLLLHYTFYF